MYDPALNPLELEPSDFNTLFANNGLYDMHVEECTLRDDFLKDKYAALYDVVFEDDGSYPDDKSRQGLVFIEFTPNGTLFAYL